MTSYSHPSNSIDYNFIPEQLFTNSFNAFKFVVGVRFVGN